jgi:hypothetical protein
VIDVLFAPLEGGNAKVERANAGARTIDQTAGSTSIRSSAIY